MTVLVRGSAAPDGADGVMTTDDGEPPTATVPESCVLSLRASCVEPAGPMVMVLTSMAFENVTEMAFAVRSYVAPRTWAPVQSTWKLMELDGENVPSAPMMRTR